MSVRPNVQTPLHLEDGVLTVNGESPSHFEVLHVVVMQHGAKTDGVAAGTPEKDSVNWTAVLEDATGFTVGEAETLGVEIRVDPFEVTSWTQTVEIK